MKTPVQCTFCQKEFNEENDYYGKKCLKVYNNHVQHCGGYFKLTPPHSLPDYHVCLTCLDRFEVEPITVSCPFCQKKYLAVWCPEYRSEAQQKASQECSTVNVPEETSQTKQNMKLNPEPSYSSFTFSESELTLDPDMSYEYEQDDTIDCGLPILGCQTKEEFDYDEEDKILRKYDLPLNQGTNLNSTILPNRISCGYGSHYDGDYFKFVNGRPEYLTLGSNICDYCIGNLVKTGLCIRVYTDGDDYAPCQCKICRGYSNMN